MEACIKPVFSELGEIHFFTDDEFPPLQAADMYAAWTRRKEHPDPMWTAADHFLAKIPPMTPEHKITHDDLKKISDMKKQILSLKRMHEIVKGIRDLAKS